MQWLIDIVLAAMKAWYADYGGFHDRGPHDSFDYSLGDLTVDNAFHELDLSSIVPDGAKGIVLHLKASSTDITKLARMRRAGDPETLTRCVIRPQVANIEITVHVIIPVDSTRKIDYMLRADGWVTFIITVKGWWF